MLNKMNKEEDFLERISRQGEAEFACIKRNRSGIDSGSIDFALRQVHHFTDSDKQEFVDTIKALYNAACRQTGKYSEL